MPTHAEEDVVEPDDCIELAAASIYGAPPLESSVAVGCGAKVEGERTEKRGGDKTQPLATWEVKDENGKVTRYWAIRVDCSKAAALGVCEKKGDAQIFVDIGEDLHEALKGVGEPASAKFPDIGNLRDEDGNLTDDAVMAINALLDHTDNILEITTDFKAAGAPEPIAPIAKSETLQVENAVANGSGATVRQDGGVAIGQGAVVGENKTIRHVPKYEIGGVEGLITGFKEKIIKGEDGGGKDGVAIGREAAVTGDKGVAIGANSQVDDDSGVALGSGAKVTGANGIAIGAKASAGKDQIRIGANTQTDVWIGAYDLSDLIAAPHDHDQIWTNKDNIAKNLANISVNAAGISANRSAIADLDKRLSMVDERVSQVAAMAAALSAVPNSPDRDDGFFFGVGVGSHDGESGVALGISGRLGREKRGVVNFGAATSGGETTLRAGIGWSF